MAVQDGGMERSWTWAPPPRTRDIVHFSCTWNNVLWKELQTGWTTSAQAGVKAPCEMGARGGDVGSWELRPAWWPATATDLTGLSFSQRKGLCSMPGIPTPGQASERRASSCLQKTTGACVQGPREMERTEFPLSKDLLWSHLLRDSAQKTPCLTEESVQFSSV